MPEKIVQSPEVDQHDHIVTMTSASARSYVRYHGLEPTDNSAGHVTFWSACQDGEGVYKKPRDGAPPGRWWRDNMSTRQREHNVRDLGMKVFNPKSRRSAMEDLAFCPRYYLYVWRMGLKPRKFRSALDMGTCYAQIMQNLRLGQSFEESSRIVAEKIDENVSSMVRLAGARGVLPGGKDLHRVVNDMKSDLQKARVMAAWAWATHPMPDKWEILASEYQIEFKYATLRQPITMRVDLLLREKGTSNLYVWDDKTEGKSVKLRSVSVPFEMQPRLYRMGLQSHLPVLQQRFRDPNLTVAGFIYAYILKPTIKWKANQSWDGPPDANGKPSYLGEVKDWYAKKELTDRESPPYVEDEYIYSGQVMDPEVLIQLRQLDVAATCAPNPAKFHRDPGGKACRMYGPCPFLELCSTERPADWPRKVQRYYDIQDPDTKNDSNTNTEGAT